MANIGGEIMTNYEKYKEEIDKLWDKCGNLAKKSSKIGDCYEITCGQCDFAGNCSRNTERWLVSEYKEPEVDWSKVPVDTPILVSDCKDGLWVKRYFARMVDERVYFYCNGATSWSAEDSGMTWWQYAKLAREEDMEKYCK